MGAYGEYHSSDWSYVSWFGRSSEEAIWKGTFSSFCFSFCHTSLCLDTTRDLVIRCWWCSGDCALPAHSLTHTTQVLSWGMYLYTIPGVSCHCFNPSPVFSGAEIWVLTLSTRQCSGFWFWQCSGLWTLPCIAVSYCSNYIPPSTCRGTCFHIFFGHLCVSVWYLWRSWAIFESDFSNWVLRVY